MTLNIQNLERFGKIFMEKSLKFVKNNAANIVGIFVGFYVCFFGILLMRFYKETTSDIYLKSKFHGKKGLIGWYLSEDDSLRNLWFSFYEEAKKYKMTQILKIGQDLDFAKNPFQLDIRLKNIKKMIEMVKMYDEEAKVNLLRLVQPIELLNGYHIYKFSLDKWLGRYRHDFRRKPVMKELKKMGLFQDIDRENVELIYSLDENIVAKVFLKIERRRLQKSVKILMRDLYPPEDGVIQDENLSSPDKNEDFHEEEIKKLNRMMECLDKIKERSEEKQSGSKEETPVIKDCFYEESKHGINVLIGCNTYVINKVKALKEGKKNLSPSEKESSLETKMFRISNILIPSLSICAGLLAKKAVTFCINYRR